MSNLPTLIFIPGSWHKPTCYNKIIGILQDEHKLKCIPVTLPSTTNNPNATFKDDIDAARNAIISETSQGHDTIIIAHSYGGMVGNSAIKGLTRPCTTVTSPPPPQGHVLALILIASGFTITGLSFMDPLFGIPPPTWRIDKESGYAVIVADPREMFYHDLPVNEAEYWTQQLTTQSLKALFEGGEHAYAGWQDVPVWYVGTTQDRGLPVVLQRMQVGMVRGQGAVVHHAELDSGHSPFLSLPREVVGVVVDAVVGVSGRMSGVERVGEREGRRRIYDLTMVRMGAPGTWFRFGFPLLVGRVVGWGFVGFMTLRNLWRGSR